MPIIKKNKWLQAEKKVQELTQQLAESRQLLGTLQAVVDTQQSTIVDLRDTLVQLQGTVADLTYAHAVSYEELAMRYCESVVAGNWKRWRSFEDLHAGETCFVIGNGPSLNPADLDRLSSFGCPTFGSNSIHKIYPKTRWRPTYFVSEDRMILRQRFDVLLKKQAPETTQFFPSYCLWEEDCHISGNALYFPLRLRYLEPVWFSGEPWRAINGGFTVSFVLLQLAYYMGFKKIYLLGMDHFLHTVTDEKGNVYEDRAKQNHFAEDYYEHIPIIHSSPLEKATHSFEIAQQFAASHGFQIFNASRKSALTVFERVDFDDILCHVT